MGARQLTGEIVDPASAQPAEGPAQQPSWGLGDVAIAAFAALVLSALAVLVYRTVFSANDITKAWGTILVLVLPWLGMAGWPLYVSKFHGFGPRRDFVLQLTSRRFWIGLGAGVAGLLLAWAAVEVTQQVLGHSFGSSVGDVAQITAHSRPALVTLAVLTVVGAPVVEELLFRGLMFGALRKRGMGQIASVGWSGAAFAAFHLEPVRFGLLLVLGLLLGTVRAVTGSTSASMITHATINFPAALALLSVH